MVYHFTAFYEQQHGGPIVYNLDYTSWSKRSHDQSNKFIAIGIEVGWETVEERIKDLQHKIPRNMKRL